ncbi:unnamed protein product [Menidia menidia]|uniref:(Atlantic silverside) hypothetical protein n=1 Tax=Menidia menidia TaxID=238744 RepID=A0A8S4AG31_9TELE|nr:unnamed protein product [Menidia menidia]
MQTRLPARLAAPKLPSLAHVISLEQSREGREEERMAGAGCHGTNLGLSRGGDLARSFGFTQELNREIRGGIVKCISDSLALQESGERAHWCVVAYWEEKTRVGRLYSVQEPSLDIFYDLPQGNGFCLGQLCSENKSQLVQMVRAKIGYGIQLTREADGVWVYNRSCYPIFIKSATLDNPDSRTLLVHKVFPGFSIKAFDYDKAGSLQRPNDHEFTQQPRTGFTVQISFVKGWGQCYTRQFISSCPCWLEIIFNTR